MKMRRIYESTSSRITLDNLSEEDINNLPDVFTVELYFGNRNYEYQLIKKADIAKYVKRGYVSQDIYGWRAYTQDAVLVSRSQVADDYDKQIDETVAKLKKDRQTYCNHCAIH